MVDKIFINYRRDISASHALNVAQYLERVFGDQSIFIDIDRMRAGENFKEVLEDRLSSCKVMLVIISPKWADVTDDAGHRRLDDPTDWVRVEIARALARRIVVIPVLVGGAKLPREAELPLDLHSLIHHQSATITTINFRNDMAGLVRDIQHVQGRARIVTPVAIYGGLFALSIAALTLSYVMGFLPGTKRPHGTMNDDYIDIPDSVRVLVIADAKKRNKELIDQINVEIAARKRAEEEVARQYTVALNATKARETAQIALKEAVQQVEAAAKDTIKYKERQAEAEAEATRQAEIAAEATAKHELAAKAAAQAKQQMQEALKDAKSDQDARQKVEAEAQLQAELAARAIARSEAALKTAAQAKELSERTAKQEAEQKQRQKAAQDEIERQAIVADMARLKQETAKEAADEAKRQQESKQVSVDAGSRQSEIDTAALIPNWSKAVVVRGISVSPEANLLAAAYDDGYVRLWRLLDLKFLHAFNAGSDTRVNSVAFSPDGKKLASASWDGSINLWDLQTWSLIDTLKDGSGKVYSVAFYNGAQEYLASGHDDGTLKIWNLRTRKRASDLRGPGTGTGAYAVAYRPRTDEFVYSIGRGGIRYMRSKGGHIDLAQAHTGSVLSLAFSGNGSFFVSGGYDGVVKVWNAEDRALLKEIRGHSKYVLAVAVSANSDLLATAGGDKAIKIWDVGSHSEKGSMSGHSKDVESLAFLPNGKFLISSSEDKTLRVWNIAAKQQVAQIIAFTGMDGGNYLVASADGKFFTPAHAEQFITVRIDGTAVPLSEEIRARRRMADGIKAIQ